MNIANSVIVITAAGSPTGRAIAEYFCQLGARVALVDSEPEKLQSTYDACIQNRGDCYAFTLKNEDAACIDHLFDEISSQLGSIDVLINYWHMNGLPCLLARNPSGHHTVKDLTANLYLFGRCAALKMIHSGRKGVIVNIPCLENQLNSESNLACSNAVVRGLTQSWALELASANIRVAGVLPQLRHIDKGLHRRESLINYDMIDGAVYIVENDSFTGRMLETIS